MDCVVGGSWVSCERDWLGREDGVDLVGLSGDGGGGMLRAVPLDHDGSGGGAGVGEGAVPGGARG